MLGKIFPNATENFRIVLKNELSSITQRKMFSTFEKLLELKEWKKLSMIKTKKREYYTICIMKK